MSEEPQKELEDHEELESMPMPPRPREVDARRRWLRVGVFLGFAGVAAFLVVPRIPRAQHVRLHLGVGSSRVVRVIARASRDGKLDRESELRFDKGAPPTVNWELELPNETAQIEVELASATGVASRTATVVLNGDEVTVELQEATRDLP